MRSSSMLLALAILLAGLPAFAQNQPTNDPPPPDLPYSVAPGTRFLIALENDLNTEKDRAGQSFKARTLEPITTAEGFVLPSGAEIHGHIDKVQSAGKAGRARIWLTFDTIATPHGRRPLVADVSDTPGEHAIRVGNNSQEGVIEARTDKRQQEAQAAAAGAFAGAASGVLAHNPKEAAIGAAIGAATAFMVASGLGQELALPKDTKLELILERPLYLGRT